MKKLYIIRHSKAVEMAPDFSDFSRCLAENGIQKATAIATHLAQDLSDVDLILSSPACRAIETAKIFAEKLNYPTRDIILQQPLYHFGGIEQALDIISNVDDDVETLMLFGHNPTFNSLSWNLCPAFRDGMPTSSVVGITFNTRTWSKATKKGGKLLTYLTNKNLG